MMETVQHWHGLVGWEELLKIDAFAKASCLATISRGLTVQRPSGGETVGGRRIRGSHYGIDATVLSIIKPLLTRQWLRIAQRGRETKRTPISEHDASRGSLIDPTGVVKLKIKTTPRYKEGRLWLTRHTWRLWPMQMDRHGGSKSTQEIKGRHRLLNGAANMLRVNDPVFIIARTVSWFVIKTNTGYRYHWGRKL